MILADTGPLVALLDKHDPWHSRCVKAAQSLPSEVLLTTWPCFTEAMYLLGEVGGFRYQSELWKLHHAKHLILQELNEGETTRMADLMDKHQDTPMDLADASLLVIAEKHNLRRIFALDSHFDIYRLADASVLTRIP